MNISTKIFFICTLLFFTSTAVHSQDCNSYLKQATELLSQKKYCEALKYYRMYSKCNADADVTTEIAMCERFCKINVMEGVEDEPVVNQGFSKHDVITLKNGDEIHAFIQEIGDVYVKYKKFDNPNGPIYTLNKSEILTIRSESGNTNPVSTTQIQVSNTNNQMDYDYQDYDYRSSRTKFKFGLNGGLLYPMEKEEGAKTYLFFGGDISGEYLATQHIGIGLSIGYYGYQVDYGRGKAITSIIPVTLTGKFYILTNNVQPYIGFDAGLYLGYYKEKNSDGGNFSSSGSSSGFAPAVGVQFKLSNNLALSVNGKYNVIFPKDIPFSYAIKNGLIGCNLGLIFAF